MTPGSLFPDVALEDFAEFVPAIVFAIDTDGRIIYSNVRLTEITGFTAEEIYGRQADVIHPCEKFAGLLQSLLAQRISELPWQGELSLRSKEGQSFRVNASIFAPRPPNGERTHYIVSEQIVYDPNAASEQLRTLVDNLPGGAYRTSLGEEGRILFMAGDVEALTGLPAEHFAQKSPDLYTALIHPDDVERVEGSLVRATETGEIFDAYYRLVRPDGEIRWVRDTAQPIFDESEQFFYSDGVVLDVSGRVAAEERSRALLDASPDAIVIMDRTGIMTVVSRQAEQLFGRSRSELIGQHVGQVLRIVDGDLPLEELMVNASATASSRIVIEAAVPRGRGSPIPVEVCLGPFTSPEGVFITAAVRDITAQKKRERELKQAKQLLQGVADNTDAVIYVKDVRGRYMLTNRKWAEVCDISPENALGRTDYELFPPKIAEDFVANDRRVQRTRELHVLEETPDSGTDARTFISSKFPLFDEQGRLLATAGVSTDVTRLKNIERELRSAREAADAANHAKSTFLANMSHELRTPMNAIIGYSEMLIEDADVVERDVLVSDLQRIVSAGRHLLDLINDVLDLSKIEAGRMEIQTETFDVCAMVTDVATTVEPLVAKSGNSLTLTIHPTVGTINADLRKLRQALFNLVGNAAKFTSNGQIRIAVEESLHEGRPWLVFDVSDTGIGIAADKLDSLFDEFSQADPSTTREFGGTGLGLAITRRFCEMMGGSISVTSKPGRGSTFTMRIPQHGSQESYDQDKAAPTVDLPQGSSAERPLVLVIDDDETARDLIGRTLEKEGFAVRTAKDGVSGMALARELAPRAITLDVMMPHKDGWTVLRELKSDEQLRDIPVVIISIVNEPEMGLALGAIDYLVKPIDRERLVSISQRYRRDTPRSHVLIVDDDRAVRITLRRALEQQGWCVTEAANGRAALEHVGLDSPDLIILDITMPVMNGFEFLAELRNTARGCDIPVIVSTSRTLDDSDFARLRGNVQRVLSKSATSHEELLDHVRRDICAHVREYN